MINICYLPGGRSVWEKAVPEVLSTARGRRPRAVLKTKGTAFSHTDRPRPVNNLFIFSVCFLFSNLPRIARIKIRTVVRIVKSWTGCERAISQSDSRIWDSGPLRCFRKKIMYDNNLSDGHWYLIYTPRRGTTV